VSESSIEEALRQAGAPDYMVLIITKIVSAEDAIREMQASLSKRSVELHQNEEMFAERQAAFVAAAKDMTDFANRLYGPGSELSQINHKLDSIELANVNRYNALAARVADLESRKSA